MNALTLTTLLWGISIVATFAGLVLAALARLKESAERASRKSDTGKLPLAQSVMRGKSPALT